MIPKKKTNGTKVKMATINELPNILYKKLANIFRRVCPPSILANNLKPKLAALAIYEITSIKTNKGIKGKGVPEGIKYEKKCNLWVLKPKIVTPVQIVKLKPIATIAEVVIVKL